MGSTFQGSVSGTLQRMQSYTLQSVGGEVATLDVHLPASPVIAQITLNHFNKVTGSAGVIFDVDGSWYFTNCVYVTAKRVSFAALCFPGTDGIGASWCMALANIFQFSDDSKLEPTPIPPQPEVGFYEDY